MFPKVWYRGVTGSQGRLKHSLKKYNLKPQNREGTSHAARGQTGNAVGKRKENYRLHSILGAHVKLGWAAGNNGRAYAF